VLTPHPDHIIRVQLRAIKLAYYRRAHLPPK